MHGYSLQVYMTVNNNHHKSISLDACEENIKCNFSKSYKIKLNLQMLTSTQQSQLIQILSDTQNTFEHSLDKFQNSFKKIDYFSACWTIQHLIKLNVL